MVDLHVVFLLRRFVSVVPGLYPNWGVVACCSYVHAPDPKRWKIRSWDDWILYTSLYVCSDNIAPDHGLQVTELNIVASELNDPIWHSSEWQIGSFSSEATDIMSRRKNESIVIEVFLRLKMHRICAGVPRFDIKNFNFIVSMAKPWNIRHAVS